LKWGGALAVGSYCALKLLQPRMNRWGAEEKEDQLGLPGAELLEGARIGTTQALTMRATPEQIWPWLIQMGEGRGGFYSYQWVENLFGCRIKNADHVIPELQNLHSGDSVSLSPKTHPLKVTRLEPGRVLALEGWIFFLKPIHENQTRLVVRTYVMPRASHEGFAAQCSRLLTHSVFFDLAHFLMGRKQLLEIKKRVETSQAA
jgi:hypothetical protein